MSIDLQKPIFQAIRSTPTIPQAILDAMIPSREPEEFSLSNGPLLRALREAAGAAGLGRTDLLILLGTPKNSAKAYRKIDATLDGSALCPEFVQCLAEAVGFTDEKLAEIEAEHTAWRINRWRASKRRHSQNAYRRYGPHIYLMPLHDWYPSLLGFTGDGYLYIQVPHAVENDELITPDLEAISQAIRHPPQWLNRYPSARMGAYLYHRLPDEMAFFDLDGTLIRHGDCSLEYPEGTKRFFC